ncbi:MAG TPA: hypothetical protein VH590_16670 [Ktedonobacterales bacterium]
MPEVVFALRGERPIPFAGGAAEKQWWQTLATKAQAVRASRSFSAPAASTRFALDVVFFLTPENGPGGVEGTDLDNLAKPVLDTLFKARKQQPTGALFDLDDASVIKLTLEKRLVSTQQEEGIDITIVWG